MKKLLLFLVCLVFTMTAWVVYANQLNDLESNPILGAGAPVSQILEKLSTSEKENAIIDIECDTEAEAEANLIEEKWNSGNYEEAIELLKNSSVLENAAIGIQWKEPVATAKMRWGDDIRIGNRDSIRIVSLDVDNSTGYLFAVLGYQDGLYSHWAVNISTDTGKTWAETYSWGGAENAPDVDGNVLESYFYVAYLVTTNNTGRIRRFNTSNGSVDDVYFYKTVIDEGVALRDIALTSTADRSSPNYHLLYFSIMDNDSLRNYWSNVTDSDGETWSAFDPNVGNADRGLDACCAVSPSNNMWASYIGTDDSLYIIGGWNSWSHYGPWVTSYTGTYSEYTTSIGAYGDTVIAVHPYRRNADSNYVRYRITYTGGSSWTWGTLYGPSNINSRVNDLTARLGDGISVFYQTSGDYAEGLYRHRGYPVSAWSSTVSLADSVTRFNVKPSIERIASDIYGIAYTNYPEEIALFDRSDWASGIEEDLTISDGKIECSLDQNIIIGAVILTYTLPGQTNVNVSLINILGQKVSTLDSGEKAAGIHTLSVSAENLSQGVYYIVVETEDGLKGVAKATVLK